MDGHSGSFDRTHDKRNLTMEMTDILKKHTETVEGRLAELGGKYQEADMRLADLEQKEHRPRGGGYGGQSWGQQIAHKQELTAFASDQARPGTIRLEIKADLASGSAATGGGFVVPHTDAPVGLPQRPTQVRQLLAVAGTNTGVIHVPTQTGRTNNAAVAPELTEKPESEYTFDLKEVPIVTIAHHVSAARQILQDAPQLASLIDSELRYGLQLAEDAELLFGTGTGGRMTGLMTAATAYSAPITPPADPTIIDRLGLALLQAALSDVEPDGIILHPSDWMRVSLTKDAAGGYILANPAGQLGKRLWNVPVVTTQAMTAGSFLVGAFQPQTLYDRMRPTVLVSTEHGDNFIHNRVTLLAEERIGLAVKRPTALVKGTFA